MSKKQKTLLEVWNKSSTNNTSYPSTSRQSDGDAFATNSSNSFIFQRPSTSKEPNMDENGFDPEAGKTWIYPTNYPIREYQFSIVQEALFKNTLVILPTGLGKTFIAAVVMFNIYRWYPNGKVVFMAPTRPLVAQQIDACHKVTGIPQIDTTQMTGTNVPEDRKRLWSKKRVFFLTPQVLVNDLVRNICPASSIKCLVVDEAHKALGNQAYCQVIRELRAFTDQFRVLALTATPGSDTQAVKMVISNLLISHVEMRSEESEDVRPYTHERDIEKIIVPLGEKLMSIKSRFLDVINIYLKRLNQRKAIGLKNPSSLSKFQVLKMREDFSQRPPNDIDKYSYGLVLADFSLCISLYHAYELLLLHGARPFYNFLTGIVNGEKSIPHARSELLKNYDFKELMKEVEKEYIPVEIDPNSNADEPRKVSPGHPKLEKLLEVVLKHFNRVNVDPGKSTRVMIFSQYRDSVDEIVEMLNYHKPMIKAMSFIGQTTKSGSAAGFSQKHQLKVIQEFRSGGYNTLVSTCVGEEGLDIGEVDLIVCYDCPKSPIRLVQRMGRTGRLRKGSIVILVAEGKEEQMLSSCESKKKSIHKAITKGFSFAQLYSNSPSLLPSGLKPVCVKTSITVETSKAEKTKFKGKTPESPFLNAEEMLEYNNHFKFPKNDAPVLADSNIISLSNPPQLDQSVKPRLSLTNWMLWQTTPQRIHRVSHSSRSLLLVDIVDKVNFPRHLVTAIQPDKTPSRPSVSTIANVDMPVTIDLCSDEDDVPLEFHEIPGQKNENFQTIDLDVSRINPISKIDRDAENYTSERIPSFISKESKEDTLLKRLFGISFSHLPKMSKECTFEDPPSIDDLMSIEKLPTIHMEDLYVKKCQESKSKLYVLCNKMKALWKRKSKNLGFDLSLPASSFLSRTCPNNVFENSVLKSPVNVVSFDVSFLPPDVKNNSPEPIVNDCITFDINFDLPVDFDSSENKENFPEPNLALTGTDKPDNPESPFEVNTESSMLSEDASMIVEQLLSSREDVTGNLDSSFAVPLTVKKVVLENSCITPLDKMSEKEIRLKNFSGKEKTATLTEVSEKNLSVKPIKVVTPEVSEGETSEVSSSPNPSPWRLGKMLDTKERKGIESEPTQCTMSQLLSLINTSGLSAGAFSPQKYFESPKKHMIESSEDEIEPTPPRERKNHGVKFCYRTNSCKSESQLSEKDGFDEDELKAESHDNDFNEAIYFDLSDFSPCDFLDKTLTESSKATPFKSKNNLINNVSKGNCDDNVTDNPEKFLPDIVMHKDKGDLLERKDVCEENADPEKKVENPISTSFEGISFDISFDIPDFDDALIDTANPSNNAVSNKKAGQAINQSENKSISINNNENLLKRKTNGAILSAGWNNQVENRVSSRSETSYIEKNCTDKDSLLKAKNQSTESTFISNHSSRGNSLSNFKFKVPNSVCSKPPSETRIGSLSYSSGTKKIEFDLSDFSSEPESESLIKQSDKTQRLDDPKELNDFEEPVTKNKKTKAPPVPKKKKVSKSRNKNAFMLSQVDVSGSDSSGDNVSCDEDLDALEESFIDDEEDDTECEKNEHFMYLQSVKNVVGPQRFKFKENLSFNHSVYSQPIDEGCSKYLLDSFCVDDECVTYSSSDEDIPPQPRKVLPAKSMKKRKRIITESSSDEEVYVKKMKNSTEFRAEPESPNLKENTKGTLKRIPSHRILSSDEDDAFSVKRCKKSTSLKPNVIGQKQDGLNLPNPVISFDLTENLHTNTIATKDSSKSVDRQVKINDKPVKSCNISFDIGWDDFTLDLKELDNTCKLKELEFASNTAMSTTLNQNPKEQIDFELDDFTLDLVELENSSKVKELEKYASSLSKVDEQPVESTWSNRDRVINKSVNQNRMNQVASLALPSPILPPSSSYTSALPFSSNNSNTTALSVSNAQRKSSPVRQVQPFNNLTFTPVINAKSANEKFLSSNTINTTTNSFNASSPNLSTAINSTILVDSRELASGKPVISALRNKHGVNPVVMQLSSADYIISNKVAVERVFDSEFNGTNMPPKVLEKVKAMSELYEKSFVIIEADSRKKVLGFNKLCTKYLHFTVCANVSNSVKMLYSRSFEETSDIIFNMIQKETAKELHITVPVKLNESNQKLFAFYQSIPYVTTICALNFVYHFPVIHMIFRASLEELKKAGCISTHKARLIQEYFFCEMSFTSFS